jgi:hypothetical protein
MNNVFVALLIGIGAGPIDVTPMVLQKINRYSILSVFAQWVVLGLLIPFVERD